MCCSTEDHQRKTCGAHWITFDHKNKIVLTSYVLERNRNVCMMSSSHSTIAITSDQQKPTIIKDYNRNKDGVDTLDENCEEFNCLRKAYRWTIS